MDYENHLTQFQAHLAGTTSQSLPSSFVPPAGYWSSREKDAFFHALAVHSRLRPDLIADSLKSKSVLDVCAYLDVSDSWVDYEEEQADEFAKFEPGWEEEVETHKRAVLLASRFQDDPMYWDWKEEQESLWRKQDAMKQLGRPHLSVMEQLIQKSDTLDSVQSRQTTEPPLENSPIHDGLIDPVLLAQSLPSSTHTEEPVQPVAGPSHPSTSASPQNTHVPPSAAYLRALSPVSRRRLQKTLSMRKKRAEAKGVLPNLLPVNLTSLRPKKMHVPKPRPHKYTKRKKDDGDGRQRRTCPRHINESGLDTEEKIHLMFKDRGIDGNTLMEWGLDVFHLRKLGKLMGLLDGAYADPGHKSSISVATIRLLHSILVDFTSTVVQGAIAMREQEVILKRNVKIWRLLADDQINPGNIRDALQMHGFSMQSLLTDFPEETPATREDEEEDADRPEQEEKFHARLPLHRELVSSFVLRPPKLDEEGISLETDMDELLAELDDEDNLDKLDRQLEAQYEKELWQAAKG
ncbi:hypothetical protein K438DRAFT_1809429 [Mycena galopus ATCC 62051]|nr:hypothetical protein K438DRAFT_1809429 [Mycena galopus ATCC 62051]